MGADLGLGRGLAKIPRAVITTDIDLDAAGRGVPLLDSPAARRKARIISGAAAILIALVDWRVGPNISLGFLYIFPILVVSLFAQRWQIGIAAIACGILREVFSPLPWDGGGAARVLMGVVAFLGSGLFVSELARNRRLALEHGAELRRQIELREDVQEELRVLVESSPAAIFTLDAEGRVLLANEAAHRFLAFDGQSLQGQAVRPYLPALASALERPLLHLRTNMECVGRRHNGEVFLAHIWFSSYPTRGTVRLAAIAFDVSEQLRDREVLGLDALAAASRVLFGAVSHEVRNLAAAAEVVHANLGRTPGLSGNDDFKALGALVTGLEQIASADLRLGTAPVVDSVDLRNVLDELRIVLEPTFREEGLELEWRIPPGLPNVTAEPRSLLQIFLNLAQNSEREMARSEVRRLTVRVDLEDDGVVVRFEDTGPGVRTPDTLFQPFRRAGRGGGLGLFVSRTIARSFAGDVQHEPRERGSCFAVRLTLSRLPVK